MCFLLCAFTGHAFAGKGGGPGTFVHVWRAQAYLKNGPGFSLSGGFGFLPFKHSRGAGEWKCRKNIVKIQRISTNASKVALGHIWEGLGKQTLLLNHVKIRRFFKRAFPQGCFFIFFDDYF